MISFLIDLIISIIANSTYIAYLSIKVKTSADKLIVGIPILCLIVNLITFLKIYKLYSIIQKEIKLSNNNTARRNIAELANSNDSHGENDYEKTKCVEGIYNDIDQKKSKGGKFVMELPPPELPDRKNFEENDYETLEDITKMLK